MDREFLDKLRKEGKVIALKNEPSVMYEITPLVKYAEKQDKIIIGKAKESNFSFVANVYGSKKMIADALGVKIEDLLNKLDYAIENPKKPEVVETGFDVVEEVDLDKLPIPLHFKTDGGKYFTSGVIFAKDKELGQNASFHRIMVLDRKKGVMRILERNLNEFIKRNGGELEVAFAVGLPIQVLLASAMSVEIGKDELWIANSIKKTDVVELENGIRVPANSEYVLTGKIIDEWVEEGPFVDLTETKDIVRKQRVIVFDKIYRKKDMIHHVLLPGGLEHKVLMGMPKEPVMFNQIKKKGVDILDVNINPGGCSWLHAIVKINKKNEEDIQKTIEGAFEGHRSLKHLFIVDKDIDIYNPLEVEWAMATRFQADKDLYIFKDKKGSSLDPSADPNTRKTTKVAFDLTYPIGRFDDFKKVETEKIDIKRFI